LFYRQWHFAGVLTAVMLAKIVAAAAMSLLLLRPDDEVVDTLEPRGYEVDSDRALQIDLSFTLADVSEIVDLEGVDPCSIGEWKCYDFLGRLERDHDDRWGDASLLGGKCWTHMLEFSC
jgi:hypothetical protein